MDNNQSNEPYVTECDCCKDLTITIKLQENSYTSPNKGEDIKRWFKVPLPPEPDSAKTKTAEDSGYMYKMFYSDFNKMDKLPEEGEKKWLTITKTSGELIPLGLNLRRDTLKPGQGGFVERQAPYTSSHDYVDGKYEDDAELSCLHIELMVVGCDRLIKAAMVVYDEDRGVAIFRDDLSKPKSRPGYKRLGEPDFLMKGTHLWQWDGYDDNGVLDTEYLRKANLTLRFEYQCCELATPKYVKAAFGFVRQEQTNRWLDVKISDPAKSTSSSDPSPEWQPPEAIYSPPLPGWSQPTNAYEIAKKDRPKKTNLKSAAEKKITITARVAFYNHETTKNDTDSGSSIPYGEKSVSFKYHNFKTQDSELQAEMDYLKAENCLRLSYLDGSNFVPDLQQYKDACDLVKKKYEDVKNSAVTSKKKIRGLRPEFSEMVKAAAGGISAAWSRPGPTRHIRVQAKDEVPEEYVVSFKVQAEEGLSINRDKNDDFLAANFYLVPVLLPALITSFHGRDKSLPNSAARPITAFYNWGWYQGLSSYRDAIRNKDPKYIAWAEREKARKSKSGTGSSFTINAETDPEPKYNYNKFNSPEEMSSLFQCTAAHELGHEILDLVYGNDYSVAHKFSSTWDNHQVPHPHLSGRFHATGLEADVENDLMKYPADGDDNEINSFTKIASANDVRGVIYLTKLVAAIKETSEPMAMS
ncbi:hypothetical protein C4J81_00845 [Deltaproteobacteria bacterium Smac51]|nr:hypothetical protein C4J81_00845 [Deltaproteobacteria bacterium Smac51]